MLLVILATTIYAVPSATYASWTSRITSTLGLGGADKDTAPAAVAEDDEGPSPSPRRFPSLAAALGKRAVRFQKMATEATPGRRGEDAFDQYDDLQPPDQNYRQNGERAKAMLMGLDLD